MSSVLLTGAGWTLTPDGTHQTRAQQPTAFQAGQAKNPLGPALPWPCCHNCLKALSSCWAQGQAGRPFSSWSLFSPSLKCQGGGGTRDTHLQRGEAPRVTSSPPRGGCSSLLCTSRSAPWPPSPALAQLPPSTMAASDLLTGRPHPPIFCLPRCPRAGQGIWQECWGDSACWACGGRAGAFPAVLHPLVEAGLWHAGHEWF